MKKTIALLLAVLLLLGTLTSCGLTTGGSTEPPAVPSSKESNAPADNTELPVSNEPTKLVVALTSDAGGLSPYGINRGGKQLIRSAMFEPLFWIDENKNLCPVLGKSYEYKGDGVYEVELFDYITDSAGNPLKASDVVFSLDTMIAEGHGGAYTGSLSDYRATGEYTVELEFRGESVGNFETLVSYLYCVTQAAWEASPDEMATTPVGTGLYTIVSQTSGSEYVFEARDDYWQTDAQYICAKNTCNVDTLVFRPTTDTSSIAIALENGEIDYTMNIEEADRSNFVNEDGSAKDGYTVEELIVASLIRLDFNCGEDSPCQDINLRKAIATCIDSAACAFNAQASYGHVCDALVNPGFLDADESLNSMNDYYNFDVDKAKEYLAQSNYQNETLRLLVEPNANTTSAALLVQAYCRDIGINVELLEYESAVYNDYLYNNDGKNYDFTIFGVSSTNSYIWKALYELDVNQYNNGKNHQCIYDAKLQELYETAASAATNSPENADALLKYVTENCYEYGLFYYTTCYVGRDSIQKIVLGAGNAESIYNAFVMQ